MKNNVKIKRLVGIASLMAIVVVLQLFSNYVTIGPVCITLALIPIVVGAIIYGPTAGAILGATMGALVCTAPSTIALFIPENPAATIILCLLKTAAAGYCAGWIFKGLKKKNFKLAVVLASLSVPIINTGLFAVGALLFFNDLLSSFAVGEQMNTVAYLFLMFIGYNFLIEFGVNSILSPAVIALTKTLSKTYDLGFNLEIEEEVE